jgi:aspartate/methionine/tyrosine aminotransferase
MMKIAPFELERYFAQHEFSARYLLSSSDCEAFTMSEVLQMADKETLRLWEDLKLGYTETPGHPLLRETIANIYNGITAKDILVVVPEEGIFLLMHALLKQGDHVICTFPAYQSLYEIARSIGCEVSPWESDEESGWHFEINQLEDKLRSNTKLVIVNFPHNPTGHVQALNDWQAFVNLVRQRGVYLLSDEMYRFLEIDPDTTLPSACEMYKRAFSLFGLSKTFGLPGLRVGWIASQDSDILARMSILKDYTTICASAPSEILAIMALKKKEMIIAQQIERIRKNIAVLEEFFAEYDNCFSWKRPAGGSICFPRLLGPQGADEFCENLLKDAGIMLVPASMFQFGDRHVRVGFGRENLPEVISRFAEYLSKRLR